MRKNNIFEDKKKKKFNTKYFIISFSVFVLLLATFSAFIFMKSIKFDINNLFDSGAETTSEVAITKNENSSINSLTGKSDIVFICEDNNKNLNFAVSIFTDFDNQIMKVKVYEKDKFDLNKTYIELKTEGVLKAISDIESRDIKKFAIINENKLKDLFDLFDDIEINVLEKTEYNSDSFKIELDKGINKLSSEYLSKYLLSADTTTKENIICDIINNLLTPKYSEKSDELFTKFVNMFDTNISVIDYSEKINNIKIYSNATDKFLPNTEQ